MALICVASAKGSPGATTAALALTATWNRPAVLAEMDPTGSDLVYRLPPAQPPSGPSPGLLGYLASIDRGEIADVTRHTVRVPCGQDVMMGPPPTRVREVAGRWHDLAAALGREEVDVIADCGRVQPDSAIRPLFAAADLTVLVARPLVDGVAHVLARAADIAGALGPHARCHVVIVTDVRDTRSQQEVESLIERSGLAVHVLGRLAEDPEAVSMLSRPWSGRLEKSLLIRSARGLSRKLQTVLALPPEPVPTSA